MGQNIFRIFAAVCCISLSGCHLGSKNDTVQGSAANDSPIAIKHDTIIQRNSIGDSIYYTKPNISTLHARLIQKEFYGPPGFGQTPKIDAHYTFFVLVLNKPITVYLDPKGTSVNINDLKDSTHIEEIDSIQIKDQRTNPELIANVGKNVTVTGLLNQAILPSEYTPVVLDFKEIK
jgi:hypothetical protein